MKSRKLLETRERVLEALRSLARELNATVYLFGSYARGDYMLDSDVDILVVCDCFEGVDYVRRVELVRRLLPGDMGFDIIALTPREFAERTERFFYRDISRYWVEIKP